MKSLILVALLNPAIMPDPKNYCIGADPLLKGLEAPCTGILWGPEETREALRCARVEVPRLEATLAFCRESKDARIDQLLARSRSAESTLESLPRPASVWQIAMGAVAAVSVGFLAGFTVGVLR